MTDETEIVPQAYPLFVPLRRDGTEPTWDDLDKWDATLKGKTRVQLLEMMDTDVSVHRVVAWRISKANSGRISPPSRITTDGSVTRGSVAEARFEGKSPHAVRDQLVRFYLARLK